MKQISSVVSPIPKHPHIRTARMSLILMVCLLGEIVVEGVFSLRLSSSTVLQKNYLWGLGLCLALLVVRGALHMYALQDIERQRVAYIRKKSFRMTSVESTSQVEVPRLPFAITLLPQRAAAWRGLLYILFVTLVFCIPLLVGLDLFVILAIIFMLGTLFSFLFIYTALALPKAEITIEARESGFHFEKRQIGVLKEHIDWDDARLFARYMLPLFLPWQKILYYELSSSTHVITWISVPEKGSPFIIWKPALSAHEYHLQMQALCEVITAKTGLALCDLTRSREDT